VVQKGAIPGVTFKVVGMKCFATGVWQLGPKKPFENICQGGQRAMKRNHNVILAGHCDAT